MPPKMRLTASFALASSDFRHVMFSGPEQHTGADTADRHGTPHASNGRSQLSGNCVNKRALRGGTGEAVSRAATLGIALAHVEL